MKTTENSRKLCLAQRREASQNGDGDCYVPATGNAHSGSSEELCSKGRNDIPGPGLLSGLGSGRTRREESHMDDYREICANAQRTLKNLQARRRRLLNKGLSPWVYSKQIAEIKKNLSLFKQAYWVLFEIIDRNDFELK